MIARIPPVESVTAIGYVPGATVRRTAAIPAIDSGGISVYAAQPGLLGTLGAGNKQGVAAGTFLNAATARYPAVVLGAVAAQTLGIGQVGPATQVYLGGRYFAVIGILRPVPLVPALDEAALVGFPAADALLGLDGSPTQIYLRAAPDQVQPVVSVLPFTANPAQPEAVQVSLPSSILAARAAARTAYAGLFLGLGAVAVLVGDGAGAVVLEATTGPGQLLAWDLGADGSLRHLLKCDTGGYLFMNGKEIFRHAVRAVVESSRAALGRAGLTPGDVDVFVPHQANARIITAAGERLGIPADRWVVTIDRYGNTSSASIPLALVDAIHAGRLQEGQTILFNGFGAGMTWASAVLRWGRSAGIG